MTTMREEAYQTYCLLSPDQRALLKKKFTDHPSTLARIELYEHCERTGESLAGPTHFGDESVVFSVLDDKKK